MQLDFTRRQLLLVGAGLASPLQACVARAAQQFTPEAFGAKGDGITDDFEAFTRLIAAVNVAGGGTVSLARGRTYFLNRFGTAENGLTGLAFLRCNGLAIEGDQAVISVKGDFYRDRQSTRGLAGLVFEQCQNVSIRNLQLVGNVDKTRRNPALNEATTHGLIFGGCLDVVIEAVTARHFAGDGLYIRASRDADSNGIRAASRRFSVRNCQFLFNARQGLSVIQLRGGTFDNCDFSYSGYVAPEVQGPYGHHAPGAGVDVEPNQTPQSDRRVDILTGDLQFRNCRMIGNRGLSFAASKFGRRGRSIEQISLQDCELQCLENGPSRYGFIFDVPDGEVSNCTLRMLDRTAFIGWSRLSDARFRFVGNSVYGRNPTQGRPLLHIRSTRGAPVVENNRIIVSGATVLNESSRPAIIRVDNPNAILRNNEILAEH